MATMTSCENGPHIVSEEQYKTIEVGSEGCSTTWLNWFWNDFATVGEF